jgi:hypothetical protein
MDTGKQPSRSEWMAGLSDMRSDPVCQESREGRMTDYKSDPGIRWSVLKHAQRSMLHYRYALENDTQPRTDAMILGTVTHLMVFEPDRVMDRVAIWNGGNRSGNVWKAFALEHANQEIIKADGYALALQIATAAKAVAGKLLSDLDNEVAVYWTHANGLRGKGRVDHLSRGYGIIDLKTCRDASSLGFGRSAASLGYHCQAAYYVDGYEQMTGHLLPYTLIAVESRPPFAAALYTVTEDHLELGRSIYLPLLDRVKECQERGEWPAYPPGVLSLPKWALPGEDNDLSELGLVFEET